jgi:hypothetical protein
MSIQAFNEGKAMTEVQVIELVRETYSAGLTKGWLNALLGPQLDALQICRSLPQEEIRPTVPREHLEAHIDHMKSLMTGKSAGPVFDLDEVGRPIWRIGSLEKAWNLEPYRQMTFIVKSHDDIDT